MAPDAMNAFYATLYAREKDTPGKVFWHAEAMHPAIFRALCMDRNETGAIYAAAAFRLYRCETGARILAAFPAPFILEDGDDDWLGIDTVLSWNPVDDTAEVMGDPIAQVVGAVPHDEALHIHASPFAFLRALAEARAQWFCQRCAVKGEWRAAKERDLTPGLLLLGKDPAKVRWPIHELPETITVHGIDARAFNNALLRQARIPRAVAAPTPMKAAA